MKLATIRYQNYELPDDPAKYYMATKVYPGDGLGSGTIGGGAMLEYMGKQPFVHTGDKIDMEVEGIGTLKMSVV